MVQFCHQTGHLLTDQHDNELEDIFGDTDDEKSSLSSLKVFENINIDKSLETINNETDEFHLNLNETLILYIKYDLMMMINLIHQFLVMIF